MFARDASDRDARFERQSHQRALELQRVLPIMAARIRGNDWLKICVHNHNLWAQMLCQNSIMDDGGQAVQTALGRRLRFSWRGLFDNVMALIIHFRSRQCQAQTR